jgi:hypothetical protein
MTTNFKLKNPSLDIKNFVCSHKTGSISHHYTSTYIDPVISNHTHKVMRLSGIRLSKEKRNNREGIWEQRDATKISNKTNYTGNSTLMSGNC